MSSDSSIWYYKECCFCIPLEIGCFILGYLNLVLTIIGSIFIIAIGAYAGIEIDHSQYRDLSVVVIAVFTVLVAICVLSLIFDVLLLVGLHKKRQEFVRAFIIYNTMLIIFDALFIYIQLTQTTMTRGEIIGRVFRFLLTIYYLLVLKSHHRNMVENTNQAPVVFKEKDVYMA